MLDIHLGCVQVELVNLVGIIILIPVHQKLRIALVTHSKLWNQPGSP